MVLAAFLLTTTGAWAQALFNPQSVGSAAVTQPVTVFAQATGAVAKVQVLTMGMSGLDFQPGTGASNCGTANFLSLPASCTEYVAFSPLAPGQRTGAVVLLDSGGNVLATALLSGTGQGGLGVFVPGTMTTVAGDGQWASVKDGNQATLADLELPSSMVLDGAGNLYIADSVHNRIRMVCGASAQPTIQGTSCAGPGIISTIAGNGNGSFSGDGSPAGNATLNTPSGIAIDGAGNLYIADASNNRVRMITAATGIINTVAGNGSPGDSSSNHVGDGGAAGSANLNAPFGVTLDSSGNLYIADTDNHRIREVAASSGTVTSSSIISTVAGNGTTNGDGSGGYAGDNGPATSAELNFPFAVAFDANGSMYIPDSGNNRIREISGGTITTYAGNGTQGYGGDGGSAVSAELYSPSGVALDAAGNLYIADTQNDRIRKVSSATLEITTIAGNGTAIYSGDNGDAELAGIYGPVGLLLDSSGDLFIADYFDQRIRELENNTVVLDFPTVVRQGNQSAPQIQTIENDGNLALALTSINPDGNSAVDPGTTTCSVDYQLVENSDCTIGAEFAPSSTSNLGTVTGDIQIADVAPNSPLIIDYTGTAELDNATSVALGSSTNPSYYSQSVTFTATVTTGSGTGPLTGTVTFYDGATALTSGISVNAGGVATFSTAALALGSHSITADYSGDSSGSNGHLSSNSAVLTQTVQIATPTITWATPLAITYGTSLSSAQLNATASVPGTFVYSPAAGTVPGAGSQTLSVTFTPTDSVDYNSATASVTLTVNKATPTITWPSPAAISYGTALTGLQLDASSGGVAGSFVYSPAAGTVLTAGLQTLSVTFTPTDLSDYTINTANVTLQVNRTTPTITWPSPTAITYGTPLSGAQLDATASVPGSFVYSPAAGTVLTAGSHSLSVTFTPTDTTDYNTAAANVSITVSQATPTITWGNPASITYGTALSSTQLNASSGGVAGTFAYSPAAGAILTVGTHTLSVTFTPTDTTDYTAATGTASITVTQATPTITWAPPANIAYGTALNATQLDASAGGVAGVFAYSPAAGTVLTAGTTTLSVTFTPTDTTDYTTATANVPITVNKATPSIAWANPAAITYGTALGAAQLDASSGAVAGAFAYSPVAGTVLTAGTQTLSVTFTPADTTDYNAATANVSMTVNKATPSIGWGTPASIPYGTALGSTQLDASSGSVAGTFAYSPPAGTVLTAGTQTLSATFTPTDTTDYSTAAASVSISVTQTTPTLTWASPPAISYGTALSGSQLDASSGGAAGTFSYSPAFGTVLTAGTHTLSATFTPTDTTDYATATTNVSITVNKATPAIAWGAPAAIPYGTALGSTQLDASSGSVAGTFTYSPAAGTVLTAGAQVLSVTFAPTDTTDYTAATASVSISVSQTTPTLTWVAPAAISYGTALGSSQLDASSGGTAGTFSYSPAFGTVLTSGTHTLSVTFTPTDTTDYAPATATVTITVNQTAPTLTWAAPSAITYGTALSGSQLDASSGGVAGTFTYSPPSGTILPAGPQTVSVTFTPADTTDYGEATATESLTVNKATPSITWANPAEISYGTALSATQLDASSGGVAGTFAYSPAAGMVPGAGTQTLSVSFVPDDASDYNTTTATVTLAVSQTTPAITWATPAAIVYGTALSAAQLDASPGSVAGSMVYSPPLGTVLGAGGQTLSATFIPTDSNDYKTATANVTLTVNKATPTLILTTSGTPSAYGDAVTFTAAISNGVAGTLTFNDAGAAIGDGVVTGGAGTFTTNALAAGTHVITASWPGNADYNTVTSGPITQVVTMMQTSTTVTASPNPGVAGAPVMFTAKVTALQGTAGPSQGTITFTDGTVILGTSALGTSGTASISPLLAPGSHAIVATYAGDSNQDRSVSAPLQLMVNPAATSTTLTSAASPSVALAPVVLSAKVTGNGGTPGGSVTFFSDGASIGSASLDAAGTASITYSGFLVGSHSIVANYSGDADDSPSVSAALVQTVGAIPTVTDLNVWTNTNGSMSEGLVATVLGSVGPVPSGSVTFYSGSTVLGSASLDSNAVATLPVSLVTGSDALVAVYSGDTLYATSTSKSASYVSESDAIAFSVDPSSVTVQTSQYAVVTVTMITQPGVSDTIGLGCVSLPFGVNCHFSTTTVTLASGSVVTAQLTIDTNSPLTGGSSAMNTYPGDRGAKLAGFFLPFGFVFGCSLLYFRKRCTSVFTILLILLLSSAALMATGCNGIGSSSVAPGTYVIQVVGSSTKSGVFLRQNVTLKVTP